MHDAADPARLQFRRRAPEAASKFDPGWLGIAWTVLCAVAAIAWRIHAAGDELGPGELGRATGSGIAVYVAAWGIGWLAWRVAGRNDFAGAAAMMIVATIVVASPFAQHAMRDDGSEELAQVIGAMRASDTGFDAVGRGSEVDPDYVPKLVLIQLHEFDRLAALPRYADPAAKARLAAIRDFQQIRAATLVTYLVSMNRLEATGAPGPKIALEPASIERLRTETAQFITAGETLRETWASMPALFAKQLGAAPFTETQRQGLQREFDETYAGEIAPLQALVQANAASVTAELALVDALAKARGHWEIDAAGTVLADSDALLMRLQVLQSQLMRAQRDAKLSIEQFRELEKRIRELRAPPTH
jgi:hypothetical protein